MIEKLSSYNMITSLIPGSLQLEALRNFGMPFVSSKDLVSWLALAYILGLVSSRVGSLLIAPLSRKFLGDRQNNYAAFVKASQLDPKIDVLLETANGYRTLTGAGVFFCGAAFIWWVCGKPVAGDRTLVLSVLALTLLFFASYLKQLRFVSNRVRVHGNT